MMVPQLYGAQANMAQDQTKTQLVRMRCMAVNTDRVQCKNYLETDWSNTSLAHCTSYIPYW